MMDRRILSLFSPLVLLLAATVTHPGTARAQLSVSVYGVHMDPSGQDAKDFSSSSYGGGLHTSFSIPHLGKVIAGSAGIELVSFLSETHEFPDAQTGLRVQQETNQDYFRFYLGPEIGPRGPGFFRPHLGVHLAFVNYGISTDVVVPDDTNRQNEIRQSLRSEHRPTVGYDFTAAADLNFGKWFMVGGTRFSKSFNVPQQLGDGAVTIHPGYVQIYVGVGGNFAY
ncbi:MAG: hypothetical protein E6K80_15000 [Candidatus Eisenbacteria bacterium]|uniref:Outer membrane protein beta-barrel domain-containing protein n=1 Tax=Eiseniibacteriota bacterium TaxID=2212470 RepID=A0A538TVW0_UNCEI|nr:MAG: hypothetical protein E6K80_15000 [Candidatus Eisenbacteria bacterium]